MFSEKGHSVSEGDFMPFTGMGENRYLGGVAEKHHIPFDLESDKRRTYEIYANLVHGKLDPLAGVYEFIEKCKTRGLKMAVASSADPVKVHINLEEIGLVGVLVKKITRIWRHFACNFPLPSYR